MTRRATALSKAKTLESLQEWSKEHNPLDIPNLFRRNPRLFFDLVEVGVPDAVDPLLRTTARLARQTFKIARSKEGLSKYYKSTGSSRLRGIAKNIANKKIPEGKRWMMDGVPVGKQVIHRILGEYPDAPTQEDAHKRVMELLKSSYLSIPELIKKTGLRKSQARSILSELRSEGLLETKRKGSLHQFGIAHRQAKSTKPRKV